MCLSNWVFRKGIETPSSPPHEQVTLLRALLEGLRGAQRTERVLHPAKRGFDSGAQVSDIFVPALCLFGQMLKVSRGIGRKGSRILRLASTLLGFGRVELDGGASKNLVAQLKVGVSNDVSTRPLQLHEGLHHFEGWAFGPSLS